MKVNISPSGVVLWLSARDTQDWANRPGARWPCSTLAGRRLRAEFDENGLVDLTVNGHTPGERSQIDGVELNAITSDFLRDVLREDHPCWFVTVGQFEN